MTNFYKRFKLPLLFIVLLLFVFGNIYGQENNFVPGKIRIKLQRSAQQTVEQEIKKSRKNGLPLQTGILTLDILNKENKSTKMKRVFPFAGKHESKHSKYGLDLWYEISINSQEDLDKIASKYKLDKSVNYAEPIHVKTLGKYEAIKIEDQNTSKFTKKTIEYPFNDPLLKKQFHYDVENTLNEGDINVFEAWKIISGNNKVIVSIVDGGIDVEHPDLKDNLWINGAELNGEKDVDDDNNGFIDDINGYNFITNSGNITSHVHGTHVAGTVGAVNNNGIGVAGVAGGSGVGDGIRIQSSQIFNEDGGVANFAAAIVYGADNGAVISQNSWGYTQPNVYDQAILDAIDYFVAEAGNYPGSPMKGGLVLFAAGNDNLDDKMYPGYYEKALTVAAINGAGEGNGLLKSNYSNYGTWVDISAPGGSDNFGKILSTYPGGGYAELVGTSMACPHVSGVAALVLSKTRSTEMTNTKLRQIIMSSVNDLYSINSQYVGKLGSGALDAAKAVQDENTDAPIAISTLKIESMDQEYGRLSWLIPNDITDKVPDFYTVFYDKNELTKDNYKQATFKTLKAEINKKEGDIIEFEVDGLEPITKYYFAVVSTDRWGNESEISNIVFDFTNEGPELSINEEKIILEVDASQTYFANHNLQFKNIKKGILRYETDIRTTRRIISPTNLETKQQISESSLIEPSSVWDFESDWTNSEISYIKKVGSSYTNIGELDTTLPNSAAVYYKISNKNGFNLTRFNLFYLNLDSRKEPAIVEVYRGSKVKKENLIYIHEVKPRTNNTPATYYENLKEELFFEDGEEFWVVLHVPEGNKLPLSIAPSLNAEYSGFCFMSNDYGKSWKSLGAVGYGSRVFGIELVSTIEKLPIFAGLSPEKSEILGLDSLNVAVNVDVSKLKNGTYESNIVIKTNDQNLFRRVPLSVKVVGHSPILKTDPVINFGEVFEGLTKIKKIEIKNLGFGRFKTKTITSSNPKFVVKTLPNRLNIVGRAISTADIEYVPEVVGGDVGTITMTSYNGDVYKFSVYGIGIEKPILAVSEEEITIDSVLVGQDVQTKLSVVNASLTDKSFPLRYIFPQFDTAITFVGDNLEFVPKYPYWFELIDTAYTFKDISKTGVDITKSVGGTREDNGSLIVHQKIDLGFKFPFFGEIVDYLYISRTGILTLDDKSVYNVEPNKYRGEYMPNGYISPIYFQRLQFSKGGKAHYQRYSDKLIIQFTDTYATIISNAKMTFQIILYTSGDIDFVYDKLDGIDPNKIKTAYVALENRTKTDGLKIDQVAEKQYIKPKSIMKIHSAGKSLISKIETTKSTLIQNETLDHIIYVNKENLTEGTHTAYYNIFSNDPDNITKRLKLNVNVTGGGNSTITKNVDTINFGDVYRLSYESRNVLFKNQGTKIKYINSIEFKNLKLTTSETLPIKIFSNTGHDLELILNTENVSNVTDTMIVTYEDLKLDTVYITANILAEPKIIVKDTLYTLAVDKLDSLLYDKINISNEGESVLEFKILGTPEMYAENPDTLVEGFKKIDYEKYKVRSSYSSSTIKSDWVAMDGAVVVLDKNTNFNNFWKPIALPFSFNFYGKSYDTILVGKQGGLSFDKKLASETKMVITPPPFPRNDEYNNIIAPLWMNHSKSNHPSEAESGIRYKVYENFIVFEFKLFVSSSVQVPGSKFSMQAILYKNGSIKFQYDILGANASQFGLVGIENEDGTKAELFSYLEYSLSNNLAIIFTPEIPYTLDPGKTVDFDLAFDVTYFDGSIHEEVMLIESNDPNNKVTEVKGIIDVTAYPVIEFSSDTLDFGDVVIFDISKKESILTQEFFIKNTGYSKLNITNLGFSDTENIILQRGYNMLGAFVWNKAADNYEINKVSKIGPFRVVYEPQTLELEGKYENKLIMNTNDENGIDSMHISGNWIQPPMFTMNTDSIKHYAASTLDKIIYDSIEIGNIEGKSNLNIDIAFDYKRSDNIILTQSALNSRIDRTINASEVITEKPIEIYQTKKAEETLNRTLSYTKDVAKTWYGLSGIEVSGSFAVLYKAPYDGFNLSHIKTFFAPKDVMLSGDIEVEVLIGRQPDRAKTVLKETYKYNVSEVDASGAYLYIPLSKEIKIMPYESFFISVGFPSAIEHPLGGAEFLSEPISGVFYYKLSDGRWGVFDSDLGFMIEAGEQTQSTSNWITVVSSDKDTLTAGEIKQIQLVFEPSKALEYENVADIIVSTNDVNNYQKVANISLLLNNPPIIISNQVWQVYEADTLNISLQVVDKELNSILKVNLKNQAANINANYLDSSLTLNFTYIPTYDEAGFKVFNFETEDELGTKGISQIEVEVLNENRAPQAKEFDVHLFDSENSAYFEVNMNDLFIDLDNQHVTVKMISQEGSLLEVFTSANSFIIKSLEIGDATLNILGTDTEGDTDTAVLKFKTEKLLSIDEVFDSSWQIYPNPIENGTLKISANSLDSKDIKVGLYTVSGAHLNSWNIKQNNDEIIEIDIQEISIGMYLVKLESGGKISTKEIIIK